MASAPKKMRSKYDPDLLEKAVEALRSKAMGLRKAAKHLGIAFSTLGDKVNGKTALAYFPKTLLMANEEARFHKWLLHMADLAFGQTTDDIRAMTKAIIELQSRTTQDRLPSTAWVYRFFERHPDLTLRTPMSLGKKRALVSPSTVESWFQGLQTYVNAQDPSLLSDQARMFNADESGFSFDPKSRKVISWKGVKTVYSIAANNRTQVTVLACMSMAGLYLPPLLIYPYKRIPGKNLLDGFQEALLQVSDNGWITSAILYTWLEDSFIPATQHVEKPLLLLVDGHVSHKSLVETSRICEDNQVILLYCLPPHASHLVQPLDQAFLASVN